MPHRIIEIAEGAIPDPLFDFGNVEFLLEFQDAAKLLQQWRNPHESRGAREGIVMSLAEEAQIAISSISQRLMYSPLDADEQHDLVDQLRVLRYLADRVLPEALMLVTQDQLLTDEDIQNFINKHLRKFKEEFGDDASGAIGILNRLKEITDLEITDAYGNKKRISRDEVIEYLGSILGSFIMKHTALQPFTGVAPKPRGKVKPLHTYKAASVSSARVPPKRITAEDIRVLDKDRLSKIYLVVDMSQSMRKIVFEQGLTRLDGALLTALGLFYYFQLENRRKRGNEDPFKIAVVPVVKEPYIVDDKATLADFLLKATAKGKTRLVHAIMEAIKHSQKIKNFSSDEHSTLICITDGRPNVPYRGKIPGYPDKSLREYFARRKTLNPETQECMIQINQIFRYLKYSQDEKWSIHYFLIAPEEMKETALFKDTLAMLQGITKPILVDPSQIHQLGQQILRESLADL